MKLKNEGFKFKKIIAASISFIGLTATFNIAQAYNIDWKGSYRAEFVEIDKPTLTSGSRKSFLLNHLTLSPKIIASDGVNIVSSFEVFNNANFAASKVGTVWGSGVNTTPGTAGTNSQNSNTISNQQPVGDIQISQLYLNVNEEYGSLILGRAPVHFGLGVTHNSGTSPFAHWYETRDTVGYKFLIGNLFIMPSISKVYHSDFTQGEDITDETIHFEYNNLETGNLLGLFYETRKSNFGSNDTPTATTTLNGTKEAPFSRTSYNIIFGKTYEDFDFKLEGAFQSGSTGLRLAGEDVRLNGFALITEFNFKNGTDSSWNIKVGNVSGDNPNTANYEGYITNRNYDVAFLMFNYPMGQVDVLKSGLGRDTTKAQSKTIDEDGISNALFFAPTYSKKLNTNWTMLNTIAWAKLNNADIRPTVSSPVETINSQLGYEWDLTFVYKPHENIEWKNVAAFMFPGDAYKAGTMNLKKSSTVIGLQSTAAISF